MEVCVSFSFSLRNFSGSVWELVDSDYEMLGV